LGQLRLGLNFRLYASSEKLLKIKAKELNLLFKSGRAFQRCPSRSPFAGQEFSGYAAQLVNGYSVLIRLSKVWKELGLVARPVWIGHQHIILNWQEKVGQDVHSNNTN